MSEKIQEQLAAEGKEASSKLEIFDYIMIGTDKEGAVHLVHQEGYNPTMKDLIFYREFLNDQVERFTNNDIQQLYAGLAEIYKVLKGIENSIGTRSETEQKDA